MEELFITGFRFLLQAIWYIIMLFSGCFAALYLMRVNRFSYEKNWLLALGGAIMTGHLIVWIMDLSIYLILMHFMGAILSVWIYKFITKDFVPQDEKIDITDVQNSRDSTDKEDD